MAGFKESIDSDGHFCYLLGMALVGLLIRSITKINYSVSRTSRRSDLDFSI